MEMDNKVVKYITNSGFSGFINSNGADVINMGENEKGDQVTVLLYTNNVFARVYIRGH